MRFGKSVTEDDRTKGSDPPLFSHSHSFMHLSDSGHRKYPSSPGRKGDRDVAWKKQLETRHILKGCQLKV